MSGTQEMVVWLVLIGCVTLMFLAHEALERWGPCEDDEEEG